MPVGTPFPFNESIFQEILDEISNCTSGIRTILSEKSHYPSKGVWDKWLKEDEARVARYVCAKEEQADILVDEMLEIADSSNADVTFDEEGQMKVDGNVVQRDRLRIDTRKFIAMKLKPKKYGDKIDVTSGGEKLAPIIWQETKNYGTDREADAGA